MSGILYLDHARLAQRLGLQPHLTAAISRVAIDYRHHRLAELQLLRDHRLAARFWGMDIK
jgi:hypothetical protein